MSTLYIVGTPIGNLEDISLRGLRILREVDFVLCEDTRVTKKLLNHYKISTKTISYHQHSDSKKIESIIALLEEGKNIALVSDAGTPGISDPGGKLVQTVINRFGKEIRIESVPGPSAVTAALSISGIPTDKFVFMGFPPHKKGRQTFMRGILESEYPVVVYESKHRIIKFLNELKEINELAEKDAKERRFKNEKDRKKEIKKYKNLTSIVVCRELSKMHETVYRGNIDSLIEKINASPKDQKGEFVIVVGF